MTISTSTSASTTPPTPRRPIERLRSLICPSSPFSSGSGYSSYVGNHHHDEAPIDVTNSGLLYLNSRIRDQDIDDGRTNTILISEQRSGPYGWFSGTRATLRNGGHRFNAPGPFPTVKQPDPVGGFGSYHPGGVQVVFADGHAAFLKNTISPIVLQRLMHRADGELIDESQW